MRVTERARNSESKPDIFAALSRRQSGRRCGFAWSEGRDGFQRWVLDEAPGISSPGTLTFGGGATVAGTYAWKLATAGSPDPTFSGASTPAGPQTNHDALAITA